MSRSRYRPKYRPEKPTGAPCRDLRRAEVEERGYERCEFVPLHGRPRRGAVSFERAMVEHKYWTDLNARLRAFFKVTP